MANLRPTVVFCTATQRIIDYVHVARGETEADAVKRLLPDYGTALTAMPADEAQDLYEASFKSAVEEITEKDFLYALNVLPPVGWVNARGAQSFKISERLAGRITSIHLEMQGRFFRFHDDIRLSHNACCERVAAFIAANPKNYPEASA